MRKNSMTKIVALFGTAVLMMGSLAGCGQVAQNSEIAEAHDVTIMEEIPAKAAEASEAPFFTEGVYVNYAEGAVTRDYFYVFYDEGAGYTEDGNNGTGLPFCCTQENGQIAFSYGGNGESSDVFTVESIENGVMKGHFKDTVTMYFEPVFDADPDNFDAVAFVDKSGRVDYRQYNDPNGWSVTYNAACMEVTQQDNMVFFVYTGECGGSNVITATYDVSCKAKEAVDNIVKGWGNDNVTQMDTVFPGTEDVPEYFAMLPPADEGSGLYETVIARDYMDGCLIFECLGHNCGDDEIDMAVSDNLALVIDSITFNN
jgi:hypothetical protein